MRGIKKWSFIILAMIILSELDTPSSNVILALLFIYTLAHSFSLFWRGFSEIFLPKDPAPRKSRKRRPEPRFYYDGQMYKSFWHWLSSSK